MRTSIVRYAAIVAAFLIAAACSSQPASTGGSGTATLNVFMMDTPFRFNGGTVSAVDVAVKRVELIGSGGHITLATFSPDNVINLLNFQNTPLMLSSTVIPAGVYQQLRLILDTSSTATNIVVNGTTFPLNIPSATGPSGFGGNTTVDNGDGPGTSGIKINAHFMAQGGFTYGWLIDFNAAESIVLASGTYKMKPVLVATVVATSGAIAGKVTNPSAVGVINAQVLAEQGGTPINSGVTDMNGNYQINGLPAGTYTLVVNNTWTNQAGMAETASNNSVPGPITVNGVVVNAGQVTTQNITD